MSKDHLEPGDIVRQHHELGVVMRNDEDSGLLVAWPGMDELTVSRANDLEFVSTLKEAVTCLNVHSPKKE